MSPRYILTQNKRAIVSYNEVEAVQIEQGRDNQCSIYASTRTGDKIWLGTYHEEIDAREVIAMITRWIDYAINPSKLEQYQTCTGSIFHMPKFSECHNEPQEIKEFFIEKSLTDKELNLATIKQMYSKQILIKKEEEKVNE